MMQISARKMWRWSTRFRLLCAGWRPARNVWNHLSIPTSLTVFPEARRVLSEFGALHFGNRMENVRIVPTMDEEIIESIKQYEIQLGTRLYPIGIMEHQDRHYLLIDENGVIYTLIDQLEPLASTFELAIEYFVHMTVNRRKVESDLQRIGMFGKVWTLGTDG